MRTSVVTANIAMRSCTRRLRFAAPPGSHSDVSVDCRGPAKAGYEFNVEHHGKTVRFSDGQSGDIAPLRTPWVHQNISNEVQVIGMNLEDAYELANQKVDELQAEIGVPLAIVHDAILETTDGWYFPYNSRELIETGNVLTALAGNLPVKVTKTGRVTLANTPDEPGAIPPGI